MDTDETIGELLESSFLKCTVCSQRYEEPSKLPCLHTFCRKCIECLPREITVKPDKTESGQQSRDHDDTNAQSEVSKMEYICCPICHSAVGISENGGISFSEDSFLHHMCEMYNYKHQSERSCDYCKFDKKTVQATSLCLECHDDMCDTCSEAHRKTKVTREHKVVPYKQIKNGLYDSDIREAQSQKCPEHDLTVSSFCESCDDLACRQCAMESHSDHKLSALESMLPKHRQQVKGLHDSIESRVPNIEKYVQFLNEYNESLEDTKQRMISNMENQANTLHTLIDESKNRMQGEINEKCDTEKKMVQSKIANLETGSKSLRNNASYIKRLMKHGKADEILSLHREITTRLTQLLRMQLDGVDGKLQISFSPGNPSEQNVSILFGKLHIDNVPIGKSESQLMGGNSSGLRISSVLPNVRSKVELVCSFDSEGQNDDKDVWPTGIAIAKSGDIVIADRDNKKIKIFNDNGKLKTEFFGKDEHKIGTPFDTAALLNGNIAVTDYEHEDVKVFTRIGDHVFTIKGYFKHPRGITITNKGEIAVVDCRRQQISVHDPKTGNLIRNIECKNESGAKVLVDPYYISTTHDNNFIVTDTAAPNIKVFSASGKYLAEYGNYGTKEDQILQPYGVCVDEYGYMFVADNHNHRVHLLGPDGKLAKFLLTKTDGLWHPMGVGITKNGYFVVTEALGKVRIFKYI